MSEMVERAAKAIWAEQTWSGGTAWENRHEHMRNETRDEARAALLAALDPEDEALVEVVAQKLDMRIDDMPESRALAQRALIALKAFAQGGSVE